MENQDQQYMRIALEEARAALELGEVPVGAVVVRDGRIVGRAGNRKETGADPTGHAEIIALRQAAAERGHWRLHDATLYCTMEPCPMCAGAMLQARLARLVYAVPDPKAGAAGSVMDLLHCRALNHQVAVESGVLAEQARALLDEFFARLRQRGSRRP